MPKRILVVTKDIGGGFNTLRPVVNLLRKEGHEVTIVAEGLSLGKWMDAGEAVYHGAPPAGQYNPTTKVRHDIDVMDTFTEVHPDAVITELGTPINLAMTFGLAANRRKIPLVFIEDLWGVHVRSHATPQLVCSIDEFGAVMARGEYMLSTGTKVVVTGNPAFDALKNVKPNVALSGLLSGVYANGKRVVVALGQDESTTPMLEGLVEALEREGNYILIPRFHPKYFSNSDLMSRWHSILDGVKKGSVLWLNNESTHEVMACAHVAVSIYSTALVEAAMLGAIPVSWMSPVGQEKMAVALGGLRKFPLVSTGAAIEVSSADEFLTCVPRVGSHEYLDQAFVSEEKVPSDGKNAERVVCAICDLLK